MRIKNWSKFQHFRDRRPPWIKLYRDVLDDCDIAGISDRSFRVLVGLWLLASEDATGRGVLPAVKAIAFRLRMPEPAIVKALQELVPFIEIDDDTAISLWHRGDAPETERETETEAKTETEVAAGRLADFLSQRIKERNPGAKTAPAKWVDDIEKMLRIDHRDELSVGAIIRWATGHDFWSGNILSGAKLRKHYDKLVVQRDNEARQAEAKLTPQEKIARSMWAD